jgi:hypothetical protein
VVIALLVILAYDVISVFAHSQLVLLCVDIYSLTRCSLSHVSLQCSIIIFFDPRYSHYQRAGVRY